MSNDVQASELFDPDDELDLTPMETRFSMGGKNYVMREATADVARRYRALLLRGSTVDDKGQLRASLEGLNDMQVLLVAGCTSEVVTDKNGNQVERRLTEEKVGSWVDRVVRRLFEKAKRLNPEIDGMDESKVKN